jgi:hypothetical protein
MAFVAERRNVRTGFRRDVDGKRRCRLADRGPISSQHRVSGNECGATTTTEKKHPLADLQTLFEFKKSIGALLYDNCNNSSIVQGVITPSIFERISF